MMPEFDVSQWINEFNVGCAIWFDICIFLHCPLTQNLSGSIVIQFFFFLQLQIHYDKQLGNLIVHVLQARNLAPRDNNGYSDPFVKVYLLPGRGWVGGIVQAGGKLRLENVGIQTLLIKNSCVRLDIAVYVSHCLAPTWLSFTLKLICNWFPLPWHLLDVQHVPLSLIPASHHLISLLKDSSAPYCCWMT